MSFEDKTEAKASVTEETKFETDVEHDDTSDLSSRNKVTFSFEELKDDFISHQTTERSNAFFDALQNGFRSLKEARRAKKTPILTSNSKDGEQNVDKHVFTKVAVSFIDPTSKPQDLSSPRDDNLLSKSRLSSPSDSKWAAENVFGKLSAIFEADYGSTLRAVQYRNVRSGKSGVISSVPVEMILTRTGNASGTGEANVAWGGLAGSAATPSMDPAEWHAAPFCHVYIAACETIDQYRTKVRPSIQAFVSQLEASMGPSNTKASSVMGSPSGSMSTQGSNSHFLIVYVPNGEVDQDKQAASGDINDDGISMGSGPVRRALASRFAKLKANIQPDIDNSTHSGDSIGSMEKDLENDDQESSSASLQMLSTHEKRIYQKILKDFPSGKVCIMSKSSIEVIGSKSSDAALTSSDEAGMVVRHQEWNTFNRTLGSVIVNGFVHRCQKYNDELRRLDAQRATVAQALKTPGGGNSDSEQKGNKNEITSKFNLGYFFLVKESLAFTYEQMQLPSEALLQYDEFRAFLPDLSDSEYKEAIRLRPKSKALQKESGPPLATLADSAECIGFRKRLRTEFDLTPLLETIRRYLFAREIRLLFKMEKPVEVVARCEAFCKHMYQVMMRGSSSIGDEERVKRERLASKWIVQFAWDVKTTCGMFLDLSSSQKDIFSLSSFDAASIVSDDSDESDDSLKRSQSARRVASQLGEFMEMIRLIFKRLGDYELDAETSLIDTDKALPDDLFQSWDPWFFEGSEDDTPPEIHFFDEDNGTGGRQFLLESAFDSLENFEKTYLKISASIVSLSRFGQRRRQAFRLQAEAAEFMIRQGKLKAAAGMLKATVKIYRWDQWDRCHFWRLFRLAYCQRTTAEPTDYLKTLATCFNPKATAVAPNKALVALQDDLELVVDNEIIGNSKYGTIAFLETKIEEWSVTSEISVMGQGIDGKQLLKRHASVGEKILINVTLKSHLPRKIQLDSIKIFIVEFNSFSNILEKQESVEEEDAYKILESKKKIELLPGQNTLEFEWSPTSAGKYVLSTMEIVWKKGFFYYDSMELPAPLFGVDVFPSKPTHVLKIEPAFLVPGHDQDIQITFEAGSDFVTSTILQLVCSDGISIRSTSQDDDNGVWQSAAEIDLGPVRPNEEKSTTAHIRCDLSRSLSQDVVTQTESIDNSHGLKVKAFSAYQHADTDVQTIVQTQMKHTSEVFAPIMEKTALSVESADVLWLPSNSKAFLSVHLASNTPGRFSISSAELALPPPLKVDSSKYFESDFMDCLVSDDDEVAFLFECSVMDQWKDEGANKFPNLRVKLQDEKTKVFTIDLQLDIGSFYSRIKTDLQRKVDTKGKLQLSADVGTVGEPIKMSFSIESEHEGDIAYSFDSNDSDWLLSGKTSGIMQRSGFMSLGFMGHCDVIAIPTLPGVITTFPTVRVKTTSTQGEQQDLKMTFSNPLSFYCNTGTTAVGVAFPTNKVSI